MESTLDPTLSPEAARAVPGLRRVLVPTDPDDHRLTRARRAATQLAVEHGWELVLYDRSHETWMDHPHPTGPVTADELDRDEWPHLVRQLRDVESAGVTATAWLATVPSLSAMVDALQDLAVDAVLMPHELDRPTLADRLLEGGDPAERVERVADLQLGDDAPPFLELDDEGHISIRSHQGGPR